MYDLLIWDVIPWISLVCSLLYFLFQIDKRFLVSHLKKNCMINIFS